MNNIELKEINNSTISNTEKINMLNTTYNQFYDKFIEISKYTRFSKLSIDNNHNVCVQIWTPWRSLYRKITKQNTLLSLIAIQNNIQEITVSREQMNEDFYENLLYKKLTIFMLFNSIPFLIFLITYILSIFF